MTEGQGHIALSCKTVSRLDMKVLLVTKTQGIAIGF